MNMSMSLELTQRPLPAQIIEPRLPDTLYELIDFWSSCPKFEIKLTPVLQLLLPVLLNQHSLFCRCVVPPLHPFSLEV